MQSLWRDTRLILLDRDGVLNDDSPDFILAPDQWHPIAGALAAVAALNDARVFVALCSNQSAVGRALMTHSMLNNIDAAMHRALARHGARLDATYYCPHHPNDHCRCRKPRAGMLERAIRHFGVAPTSTLFVGDRDTDAAAASAAGCRFYRVSEDDTLADLVAQRS